MGTAGEPRGGGLRAHAPRPATEPWICFRGALEFYEQGRVIIPRQQAEQEPIGKSERPSVRRPAELQKAAVLIDRAGFLPTHRARRFRGEEVATPQAGFLLLANNRKGFLVMQNLFAQRGETLKVPRGLRDDFRERPILNWRTGCLVQP
jgi:hypothetical protein